MFCKNCNEPLNPGQKFCTSCGTPVEEETLNYEAVEDDATVGAIDNDVPAEAEVQTGANYEHNASAVEEDAGATVSAVGAEEDSFEYTAAGNPDYAAAETPDVSAGFAPSYVKKFLSKKVISILVAAAIVVVAGFGVWAAYPYVSNSVMKMVLSPEDYLGYVLNNNMGDGLDMAVDLVDTAKSAVTGEMDESYEVGLKVEVEDGFGEFIDNVSGEDISSEIDWMKSVEEKLVLSSKKNKYGITSETKLNGKDIATAELAVDMDDKIMYASVPDYHDEALSYSFAEEAGEFDEVKNQLSDIIPDKKVAKRLLTDYIKTALEQVKDVEETKEEISADGLSVKATKLSVDLTEKTAMEVTKAVLEKAVDDKDIKEIVENLGNVEGANIDYDTFVDMVNEAIDNIDPESADTEHAIKLSLYVNGKGEIIGVDVDAFGEYSASCIYAAKGGKFGVEVKASASGMTVATIEGGGKVFSDNHSGDIAVKVAGNDILKLELDGVDGKLLKKGVFNGKVEMSMSDNAVSMLNYAVGSDVSDIVSALSGLKIEIDSSSTEKKADFDVVLKNNDDELVTLAVDVKSGGGKKVSIPKKTVDAEDADSWLEGLDLDKLKEKLEKADVPSEYLDMMEF